MTPDEPAPRRIDRTGRVFCALAALALVLGLGSCLWSARSVPFTAEGWKAGDLRDRGRMVPDLYDSKRLIGLTREEVTALLGPPTASVQRHDLVYDFRRAPPVTDMGKLGLVLRDGRVAEVLLYDD